MTLKFQAVVASLAMGTTLGLAAPSHAASFVPFSFSTDWSGNAPDGDVLLESVSYDGLTVDTFDLVTGANIVENEPYTGGNTGALSTDRGANTASQSLVGEGPIVEDPTNADVVSALGNRNLNSIIDTEDDGAAVLEVSFDAPTDRFLFWERGINSQLLVEALDDSGNALASYTITPDAVDDAGFDIRTTEIGGNVQSVGSIGLQLDGGHLAKTLRLTSKSSFNGPDYKLAAVSDPSTAVPEPGSLVGLGLVAGAGFLGLRKSAMIG